MITMRYLVILIVIVFIAWNVWGAYSSRVEQARYTLVSKNADYEIREYPAHIVAKTTVQGSYDEALTEGFKIVAAYIFGANKGRALIDNNADITGRDLRDEKVHIAMTAPVLAGINGDTHVIAFGMPASYTMDTLPVPDDPRVTLVEMPAQKMAAVTFKGQYTSARVEEMEKKLIDALARDKVQTAGDPWFAGYNAPWTPPWLVRNEVLIPIQ